MSRPKGRCQPSGPFSLAPCTTPERSCSARASCLPVWRLYAPKPRPALSPTHGPDSPQDRSAQSGSNVSPLVYLASVLWTQANDVYDLDFEVKGPLPNLTDADLPRSYAGNIPVDRIGHPNDTFFFWGFEKAGQSGSLTISASAENTDPWILWVQGG